MGRVGRLTALALATGTIVAGTAGGANAAASPVVTRQLHATSDGSALKITINLPAAAAAALGTSTIVQTISLTNGDVSTVGAPTAVSNAILGKGTIPAVSALLEKSTSATLGGKLEDAQPGFNVNQAGVNVSVLPLSSKVADPAKTVNGVLAKSSSAVAHIGVSAPLTVLNTVTAPVAQVLDTALTTATTTAGTATGTLTSTLNGAISDLNAASNSTAAPVTTAVQAQIDNAVTGLQGTLNGLTSTLTGLSAATSLVSVDSLTSDQAVTRSGDAVTSTASSAVKNVSVLGGLVKVDLLSAAASATAAGTPGSAKATALSKPAAISIANGALSAVLDQDGLSINNALTGGLPVDLQSTVDDALATVNGTLGAALGVHLDVAKGRTQTAPDGTSALAEADVATLTVDPTVLHTAGLLAADKKFMTLELVSANAAVANRVSAQSAVSPTTIPALPRTGGQLPLTGAVATALLGAALVLRRRRTVEV
jgi:hypothetical protein